jgi:cytoskeletal protein CcmA (bactofilin family)
LVEGEVTTGKLSVEVGALLNAQCVMKKAVKTLQPSHEKTKEKTA